METLVKTKRPVAKRKFTATDLKEADRATKMLLIQVALKEVKTGVYNY